MPGFLSLLIVNSNEIVGAFSSSVRPYQCEVQASVLDCAVVASENGHGRVELRELMVEECVGWVD